MITWFNSWNGNVHCSMSKCSRIITSLLKCTHMRHWIACHDFLCLCQLEWIFHLFMNVVKVHETLPYHPLFCHELLCFVLARCVSIGSDCTIFTSIFMPTLPWTSLESNFKPQIAHQFVIKMGLQKWATQSDKVMCILLYTKGDRHAQKRLAINYCN
jgi:hypothetical protein